VTYPVSTKLCPTCGTETKLLLSSVYCPKDCDRQEKPAASAAPGELKLVAGHVYWVAVNHKRTPQQRSPIVYTQSGLRGRLWIVAPSTLDALRDTGLVGAQQATYAGQDRFRQHIFDPVLDPDAFIPAP